VKVAIFGSGAVGGYFGGRLAVAGEDVTFLARGAHLAALQQGGLHIESPAGALHLPKVSATDRPQAVGPVDVVLFTVKLYDADAAAAWDAMKADYEAQFNLFAQQLGFYGIDRPKTQERRP